MELLTFPNLKYTVFIPLSKQVLSGKLLLWTLLPGKATAPSSLMRVNTEIHKYILFVT